MAEPTIKKVEFSLNEETKKFATFHGKFVAQYKKEVATLGGDNWQPSCPMTESDRDRIELCTIFAYQKLTADMSDDDVRRMLAYLTIGLKTQTSRNYGLRAILRVMQARKLITLEGLQDFIRAYESKTIIRQQADVEIQKLREQSFGDESM